MIRIIFFLIITISCSSQPLSFVYTGQRTEDNIYNGPGELTFPDGSSWKGEFVNGKAMNGEGTLYLYPGAFIEGSKNGDGEYFYPIGDKFVGKILNGLPEGIGTLIRYSDKSIFAGMFKNGKKNGSGKIIYMDGSVYEGDWINDIANGNGKFYYNFEKKYVYEGEWKTNL